MPRRFGPTLGPGTVIIEKEAGKSIQPAPTGTTVYVGRTEKGATDNLISATTQREFIANCGTYIDDGELPNAAFDCFNLSNGSANLYVCRVTDGLEVASQLEVFNRQPGTGEYVDRDSTDFQQSLMMTVVAKSGGRWGGAKRGMTASFAIPGDITETTLDTGTTMLEDEWVGSNLTLEGVTTRSYKVIGNTDAGVVSVTSDSTMATDLSLGGDAANTKANLLLATEIRQNTSVGQQAGARRALAIKIIHPEDSSGNYFGMEVFADGNLVKTYMNLSLDAANKYYIGHAINEDVDNPYIAVEDIFTGDTSQANNRPANWVGEYQDDGTSIIDGMVVCHPRLTNATGADVGWIQSFTVPSKCQPMELVVELTGAAAFKVYNAGDYGIESADGVLGTGTVGTAWVPDAMSDVIPGFTVEDGIDAYTAGDTFRIDVDPLPVSLDDGGGLLTGWFYSDKSSLTRYAVEDNTPDQITLKNALDPTPTINTQLTDTLTCSTAIVFPLGMGVYTSAVLHSTQGKQVIATAAAAYADTATLVAALNLAWQGATGEAGNPFSDLGGDTYGFDCSETTFVPLGADAFLQLVTAETTGGLNPIAGNPIVSGTRGDQWLIESADEAEGGYDGSDPVDADYLASFNTVTSYINRLAGRNLGLAKIACPGVTSTTIQKAGLNYANAKNYQYRVEIPANVTSESSAVSYINDTVGRNDFGVVSWPSYGYVVNPLGEGLILQTLTGAIQGREAGIARDYSGYYKAAAGVNVTIPNMIKDVLDGAPLNEELLNPNGVGMIKKLKGNYVVWGDRTIAVDPGWKWKHQREMMSHYEHQLQENFDWLIFMINDFATQSIVVSALQSFFLPEWQKRALRGATFDEACTIKVDSENNTDATRAAGDLNADISLRLADTVERFIITIGKKGIFDQAA